MTNLELMQFFRDEHLLDDRREYTVEDLMLAYQIGRQQAFELYDMIQEEFAK